MGNHTGKPRGFSSSHSNKPNTPSSKPVQPKNNRKKNTAQSSPQNAKNVTTNDFLENMVSDMDDSKVNTDTNQYILKKKVCAYNTNEFDDIFDEISDQIDSEYESTNDNNTQNSQKITPKTANKSPQNSPQLYVKQVSNIKAVFEYKKQLGKGGTCRVILVANRQNNASQSLYALKELSKADKYNEALFAKEIQLLRALSHNVNVVDYYGSYQTKAHYYLATQYCSGGTFLDRILKMKTFSEKIAVKYIYTILSAVEYMHTRNIVHRDLKLNNMVFEKDTLKIIDFGDSDIVSDHKSYKELVGTLYYLSPECKQVRKGWEIKKSDMWSLGVVCYILLSGKLPFSGDSQKATFKLIEQGRFEWPKNIELSDACQSFINGLLCKSTKQRLSAAQALKHEWIVDYENKANDINILDKIKLFLKNFSYNNKLHKILVNACLEEIDANERRIIVQAFHNIDMERKGNINEHDLCKYLILNSNINQKYGANNAKEHAKHIFDVIEKETNIGPKMHNSKSIPIHDFVKDITEHKFVNHNSDSDSELELDATEIGNDISVSAFKKIMNKSPKKYPINNIVQELDPQSTGYISFQSIQKFQKSIKTISLDGHEEYR